MTQRTRVALLVLAVLALTIFIVVMARTSPAPITLKDGSYITPMQAGARLSLDVSSGGIEVVAGDSPNLRIDYIGDPWREPRIGVRTLNGNASVSVQGLRNGTRLLITVPKETALRVSMGAGELAVKDLKGDKDITLYAGRVSITGDSTQYRGLDAKVLAGRITSPPMHLDKGGVFRWANWYGEGKSWIDVAVLAGEVSVSD